MRGIKTNIKKIKECAKEKKCYLLSKEYINTFSKLKFECFKGHIFERCWNDFYRSQGCPICTKKRVGKQQRKTIEEVRNCAIKKNCILLSTKYKRANVKLKFECLKNHIFEMCWGDFYRSKGCPICTRMKSGEKIAKKLRTPFEEIKKLVENEGYELLSKEGNYKNQFSYLWFRCPKGHTFKKRWDGFLAGYRCRECFAEKQRQRMLNGGAAYANSFVQNPSGPQVELFNLVKEDHPNSILNYQVLNFSIDIAIPNLKIAIEYDGSYWHQDQESDNKRQKEIEDQGWTFLRYRDYVPSKEELEKDIKNIKEI